MFVPEPVDVGCGQEIPLVVELHSGSVAEIIHDQSALVKVAEEFFLRLAVAVGVHGKIRADRGEFSKTIDMVRQIDGLSIVCMRVAHSADVGECIQIEFDVFLVHETFDLADYQICLAIISGGENPQSDLHVVEMNVMNVDIVSHHADNAVGVLSPFILNQYRRLICDYPLVGLFFIDHPPEVGI